MRQVDRVPLVKLETPSSLPGGALLWCGVAEHQCRRHRWKARADTRLREVCAGDRGLRIGCLILAVLAVDVTRRAFMNPPRCLAASHGRLFAVPMYS